MTTKAKATNSDNSSNDSIKKQDNKTRMTRKMIVSMVLKEMQRTVQMASNNQPASRNSQLGPAAISNWGQLQ